MVEKEREGEAVSATLYLSLRCRGSFSPFALPVDGRVKERRRYFAFGRFKFGSDAGAGAGARCVLLP